MWEVQPYPVHTSPEPIFNAGPGSNGDEEGGNGHPKSPIPTSYFKR